MPWGPAIRSIRELRRAIACGGRLQYRQPWQLNEEAGWHSWIVVERDGTRRVVDPRIAVTAHRKGLVKYETEMVA